MEGNQVGTNSAMPQFGVVNPPAPRPEFQPQQPAIQSAPQPSAPTPTVQATPAPTAQQTTSATQPSTPTTPAPTPNIPETAPVTIEKIVEPATGGAGENDLYLIWPDNLIAELAKHEEPKPVAYRLSLISFIVAAILSFLVGPLQLILIVLTQNLTTVTEQYYPAILRIALLSSGLVAILSIISIIRLWREQPENSHSALMLVLGSLVASGAIWFTAFIHQFDANQLSLIMILIIAATIAFAAVLSKKRFVTGERHPVYNPLLLVAVVGCVLEFGFTGYYLFHQTEAVTEDQRVLADLKKAQESARIEGVTPELSDLVFTLCEGAYDPIHILSTSTGNGLFECKESHEVYSVSGPSEPVSPDATTISGTAFYFGTTSSKAVADYFSTNEGIRYLYRDIPDQSSIPSELVMLLPAASEELLINNYLDALRGFVNARIATNKLEISLFYTPEVNTVQSTKDFILIAAADTLAMIEYLPRGMHTTGYLNGVRGTYIYTPDYTLSSLKELAASPLLYSVQTLDALTNRRHITLSLEAGHIYTSDELRDLMYANLRDPKPAV